MAQKRPRGATPHPGLGGGREEPHSVRGQGWQREDLPASEFRGSGREEIPNAPKPEASGGGQEELPHAPTPKARVSGREDQPHAQGAVAVWAQEGLEELSHVEGQEGQQ